MAVNYESYKENKSKISLQIATLNQLFDNTIPNSFYNKLNGDRQRQIDKMKTALQKIQDDIDLDGVDPQYKPDPELQLHLNQLENLPEILNYTDGDRKLKDVLFKGKKQQAWLDKALYTFDSTLGTDMGGAGSRSMEYVSEANALHSIDALKGRMELPYFKQQTDAEKSEFIAAVFAMRMTVNSKPGKASSLDKEMDTAAYKKNFRTLMGNDSFIRFTNRLSIEKVEEAMKEGHGGALEKQFKDYLLKETEIPTGVPNRYAPTALQKIEQLQKALKRKGLSDVVRRQLITEIMACRIAVKAVQGDKDSLKKPLKGKSFADARKALEKNATFQKIMNDQKGLEDMQKAVLRGHGGAAERYVQQYTATAEPVNNNNPSWLSPHAPTPKTYEEAKEAVVQAMASGNPQLLERQVAAAFYLANAEGNPNLEAGKNMESRIQQIQNSDTFRYMLHTQSMDRITGVIRIGAMTAASHFETTALDMDLKIRANQIKLEDFRKKGPENNGPQAPGVN